jgi:hypothetical protein
VAGEWGHNPCPGPPTTSGPARPATAASRAASRPSCRGPDWPLDHRRRTGETADGGPDREPRRRRRAASHRHHDRYEDRMARCWPPSSTCSIPT